MSRRRILIYALVDDEELPLLITAIVGMQLGIIQCIRYRHGRLLGNVRIVIDTPFSPRSVSILLYMGSCIDCDVRWTLWQALKDRLIRPHPRRPLRGPPFLPFNTVMVLSVQFTCKQRFCRNFQLVWLFDIFVILFSCQNYVRDFGAMRLPSINGPQRFMIEGEAAIFMVSDFLHERECGDG